MKENINIDNNNSDLKYINNLNINIPYIYFLNDPFPNNFKTLVIEYVDIYNNISKQFYKEDTNINLNYNNIIKCTYGYKSNWKDVTQIILKFRKVDNININIQTNKIKTLFIKNIDYNNLFGDPCIDQHKLLTVKYKNINNQICENKFNENQNFILNYKQIVNAFYGNNNKKTDVTNIIFDFIKYNNYLFIDKNTDTVIKTDLNTYIKTNTDTNKNNNKLLFQFINYNNLFGDPCIDQPKQLTIKYKNINNQICENKFNENQNFILNYKQIVSAFYGNNNKKTNVTNIIFDFIKYNNYLFIDKNKYNSLFGDPCTNQSKHITIKYKNINDKICINIFNENENITLNYKQIVSAFYGIKENYKKLWNFNNHRYDNHHREHTLINSLKNNNDLKQFYNNKSLWSGCFGAMSVINHDYLIYLNNIYNIDNLLNVVTNRSMRMGLERVMACMLQKHSGIDNVMFGDILNKKIWRWNLNWHNKHIVKHLPIIKIWSGR
jgi:hypothetical protein